MAVHIIIDGYNLIKQSPVLSRLDHMDIEKGRNELISRLAAYRKVKKHGITVVFDGCKGGGIKQERTRDRGINIVFSKKGEEADEEGLLLEALEERAEAVLVGGVPRPESCVQFTAAQFPADNKEPVLFDELPCHPGGRAAVTRGTRQRPRWRGTLRPVRAGG